jgi:hypothetical protein
MSRRNSLSLNPSKKNNSIHTRIISTKLIKNGFFNSNFVEYIIKVKTVYKTWTINKRYSDFEKLYLLLYKKYPYLNFPSFPPKRVFRFTDNTIEERKNKFNNFLYFINHKINFYKNPEIINFFDFNSDILQIYAKNKSMINNKNSQEDLNYFNMINNYNGMNRVMSSNNLTENINNIHLYDKENSFLYDDNYFVSFEEFKKNNSDFNTLNLYIIDEFLRNLDEQNEHIGEITKTFFNFMKSKNKWKTFSKNEIIKLLIGGFITKDTNNIINLKNNKKDLFSSEEMPQIIRGIFFHIGNYKLNNYGSKSCMNFLLKLLDTEINPEAELYINIYKNQNIENFSLMNLPELATKNGNNFNNCYKLIQIYISQKYNNNDELNKYLYEIGNENFVKSYKNWINRIII